MHKDCRASRDDWVTAVKVKAPATAKVKVIQKSCQSPHASYIVLHPKWGKHNSITLGRIRLHHTIGVQSQCEEVALSPTTPSLGEQNPDAVRRALSLRRARRTNTTNMQVATLVFLTAAVTLVHGQGRISTIQLDGTQYFISNHNPYAPELNFFLAYQYCRSIGLQLASFETKEKADALTMYLKNAGHNNRDYWTSGNKLGTNMMLWMSSGLPFNATFDYVKHESEEQASSAEDPSLNSARNLQPSNEKLGKNCVALKTPDLHWALEECGDVRDFICEQTRCYYYNYGTIPVSATQG